MKKVNVVKLDTSQISGKKIKNWPIWEKEISRFDWVYNTEEECYILDGEVVIETEEGDVVVKAGDFITFKKGLKCVWDIKSPIKKHYNFK